MMTMKHFESHLENQAYYKNMADIYNDWNPIEKDVPFYKSIIGLGFMNSYSYFSIFQHEKYAMANGDNRLFMWRNGGGNYFVEFNDESLIDRISAIQDFPVSQDGNVFIFRFFSETILQKFVEEFKK